MCGFLLASSKFNSIIMIVPEDKATANLRSSGLNRHKSTEVGDFVVVDVDVEAVSMCSMVNGFGPCPPRRR